MNTAFKSWRFLNSPAPSDLHEPFSDLFWKNLWSWPHWDVTVVDEFLELVSVLKSKFGQRLRLRFWLAHLHINVKPDAGYAQLCLHSRFDVVSVTSCVSTVFPPAPWWSLDNLTRDLERQAGPISWREGRAWRTLPWKTAAFKLIAQHTNQMAGPKTCRGNTAAQQKAVDKAEATKSCQRDPDSRAGSTLQREHSQPERSERANLALVCKPGSPATRSQPHHPGKARGWKLEKVSRS